MLRTFVDLGTEPTPRQRKPTRQDRYNSLRRKRYCLEYHCTKDHNHSIYFDILVGDNEIKKIGQYPSYADLLVDEIKRYKPVLKDEFANFRRAIGLAACDVGIGSYVYLRRIIEILVHETYEQNHENLGIPNDVFDKFRFDEKILALKDHLPRILVENRNIYGIISKGLHELSEEECLGMFPAIKSGIELILDDKLAQKDRAVKEKQLAAFVSQKSAELR